MNRLQISVKADMPSDTYILTVGRSAPDPFTVEAQFFTQAECFYLAQLITAVVQEMDARAPGRTGPDLLELIRLAMWDAHREGRARL